MDLTTTLTGMLPLVVLVSAPLTAVTSALLLWGYRRATLQGMAQASGGVELPSTRNGREQVAPASASPLTIKSWQGETVSPTLAAAETGYRRTAHALWTAAGVYAAGGLVYALILATSYMVITGSISLRRFLWLFICHAWPIVPTASLVAATSWGGILSVACGYFATISVIALWVLVWNPGLAVSDLALFFLNLNAPPTLLLLAFLHRRVRAVGPLVLAFMVAGVTGALFGVQAVLDSEGLIRRIIVVAQTLGLKPRALLLLLRVVGFVPFGVLGWWLLGRIGRYYRAKRVSDQSLTIDSLWLLFGVAQTFELALEDWKWIFAGFVAFAAYKLMTLVGFALIGRRAARESNAPMLLLLRVFALGRRSERFFSLFSKWWRRVGSISLIAGPDLVTTVVEPDEFLNFISGRLSREFVQGAADLERRLTDLDRQPDFDGRYRVNEFFCRADTWQMTMRRLAKESNAVLMDLRSFSRSNHGCLYEVEQLLEIIALERVLFLVDTTTDLAFLEDMLQRLWHGVGLESPNRATESATVRLFRVGDRTGQSMKALLPLLLSTRASGENGARPA